MPPSKKKVSAASAATRGRLIEAAGEVFAAQVYRAATVQMICQKARANVAAINYHFGDKENLYFEALRHGRDQLLAELFAEPAIKPGEPPEAAFARFVRSYLEGLLGAASPDWHRRIVAREMAEPTAMLDRFVKTCIRPQHDRGVGIIRVLAAGRLTEEQMLLIWRSVIGQCLLYVNCREALLRVDHKAAYAEGFIDELAHHITKFSLGGLEALAARARSAARPTAAVPPPDTFGAKAAHQGRGQSSHKQASLHKTPASSLRAGA